MFKKREITQSIVPTVKDYYSVIGNTGDIKLRGNKKVCICTCVHCRIGSIDRTVDAPESLRRM
jgi:hypothetical protein